MELGPTNLVLILLLEITQRCKDSLCMLNDNGIFKIPLRQKGHNEVLFKTLSLIFCHPLIGQCLFNICKEL